MRTSFRTRLMLSYICLVLLMAGVLYGYLHHSLDKYLLNEIRENLSNETRMAALIAAGHGASLRRDAPAIAKAVGKEIRARVTIIADNGEVTGDSEVKPEDLGMLENHAGRPEIVSARAEGEGTAIRYSSTLRTSMLYNARAVRIPNAEGAVIRLSLPLSQLDKARESLNVMLGIAIALALVAAFLFSYLLSSFTSRSLRAMAAMASRIGKGEYGLRVPVKSRDELGELASVMSDMSLRIEEQMSTISAGRSRLDTILRGMGEGLMVTDPRGVITLVNPAFRILFSLGDEVEGKHLMDISRHPTLNEAFKYVMADEKERQEEINLYDERGEKIILTHWVPLLDQGRLQGVVAVFHDISDIKKLEKIRKDFVANVSHELRTPVTVIKGYAETLLSDTLTRNSERGLRFLEIIHKHSERMSALIGDLLTLSELEAGEVKLQLKPLSLDDVLQHTVMLLEQKASAKRIRIDTSGFSATAPVLAAPDRVEQVFINLLDNAIKYTPENGSIAVGSVDEGEMMKIFIADTGTGIPPRDLARIFERFYRVDEARSREQGGTGLGLAIVKHIVQAHGGTITVESSSGRGSTFSFTLKKTGTLEPAQSVVL